MENLYIILPNKNEKKKAVMEESKLTLDLQRAGRVRAGMKESSEVPSGAVG